MSNRLTNMTADERKETAKIIPQLNTNEFTKQFRVTLFDKSILITTPGNNKEAFTGFINTKHEIKIGWHDLIETEENALNYHECCGILLLFGITPPTLKDLCELLA